MSAVLFTKAYPFAKRAVAVQSAAFARLLRAAGFDREDMEQELLIELFRALSRFNPQRSALRTFVDRVITSKAISVVRRALAEKRRRSEEIQIPNAAGTTMNINLSVEIRRTVMLLSPLDGRIARLLLAGDRPVEIARDLGVSRAAVYRGMDRIRDALRDHGF